MQIWVTETLLHFVILKVLRMIDLMGKKNKNTQARTHNVYQGSQC